ncbi:phenol hydroxylase subunit [Profundibacter sp.]|uniref:phenol hydroxylase subunit n=1 Tax=Profundibacter sp. TaxID=3101071 RepID=UPI003D13DA8B
MPALRFVNLKDPELGFRYGNPQRKELHMSNGDKTFSPDNRYVRITGIRNNHLIEFDFSIGEPEMYIELVLPFEAFQTFCAHNKVQYLTPEEAERVDYDRLKWRYGEPSVKI